jgi:tetratricopeptide (TPR) repeat protein
MRGAVASLALLLLLPGTAAAADGGLGEARVPSVAEKAEDWRRLADELAARQMHFGAMAAASRMLVFFGDVETKEAAYRTIVRLSSLGYPAPVKSLFLNADLEPASDADFADDYFFFKALTNQDRSLTRWSTYYFRKIKPEGSDRHLLYQAVEAYLDKKPEDAKRILNQLLAIKREGRTVSMTKKASRMLARIHFEEQQYERSLDIYESYLLRLPEVTPSDWLEAAWDLYHLRRYPQALGYLYNLESRSHRDRLFLEKFILRGLIYRALCDTQLVESLLGSYESAYKEALLAIKNGEPLAKVPVLKSVESPETGLYAGLLKVLRELRHESRTAGDLPAGLAPLARYLYASELKLLGPRIAELERDALERSSQEMVITHESLRFMTFEVIRTKIDPEKVFAQPKAAEPLFERDAEGAFRLHWIQPGDYWGDERLKYSAEVTDRCGS